jgi:23S rRNA (guanine745-N1)-methyltransferase
MSLDAARGLLACPNCAAPLAAEDAGRAWGCPNGHHFDVARQGYLNLLGAPPPANADTAEMVAARDRLLGSGLYDPIAEQVARRLAGAATIAEVGSGTGFYLARALADGEARGLALDVSVAAARRAARAHPRAASVVADAWGTLPVRSGRVAAVLCVFAPRNLAEFARVLAANGLLVVVTPTASHLDDLRARHALLGIEEDKDARLARSAVGLFEPVARSRVDYRADAAASVVRDLIAMGPNAFHGVPDEVEDAEVHVSVTLSLFRKPSS